MRQIDQEYSVAKQLSKRLAIPAILCFICIGVYSLPSVLSQAGASVGSLTFIVAQTGKGTPLPGVEVSIVGTTGIERVGVTDSYGSIKVDREVLHRSESFAILFCDEWFFCGAFRLDEPRFLEYQERYITLAPIAVK